MNLTESLHTIYTDLFLDGLLVLVIITTMTISYLLNSFSLRNLISSSLKIMIVVFFAEMMRVHILTELGSTYSFLPATLAFAVAGASITGFTFAHLINEHAGQKIEPERKVLLDRINRMKSQGN